MKRAYVVVGLDNDEGLVISWYAVCHSMTRADELCLEAETNDPKRIYTWYEVIEEDDE